MAVAGAGHHRKLMETSMAPAHTIKSIKLSLSNSHKKKEKGKLQQKEK